MSERVIAIGLDSFDSQVARELLADGRLPNLKRLLDSGRWADVGSAAHIGSGAVWPTFVAGLPPEKHGHYGEWKWNPSEMDVRRFTDEGIEPFWRGLVDEGGTVGVFDVPFAPFLEITNGFEVNEWGAHDVLRGRPRVSPGSAHAAVERHGVHPFEGEPPIPESAYIRAHLDHVHRVSVDGVYKRGELVRDLITETKPELSIIVFPEFHHAAHFLWHSMEPEHPLFSDPLLDSPPDLMDVCTALDEQLSQLVDVSEASSVFVFSLHGMRPALGVPNLMRTVLRKEGLAREASWRSRTPAERKAWVFAEVKRLAPSWIKDLYHRRASMMTQLRMARATMQDQHDWSQTKAFTLPTDQHGWARVNVAGREGRGIVSAKDYAVICKEVKEIALSLGTSDGEPLVDDVLLPGETSDPLEVLVPDVIVHWADAAFPDEMRPADPDHYSPKVAQSRTGQHTTRAFCIAAGPISAELPDEILTHDLHRYILQALEK